MANEYVLNDKISETVSEFFGDKWENTSLSDWQKEQLAQWQSSQLGIQCLLKSWFIVQPKLTLKKYCNATWDGHYCWPPTETGSVVNRTCTQAFQERWPDDAPHLKGTAFRVCKETGSWLHGPWTNYTECADSFEAYAENTAKIAATAAAAAAPTGSVDDLLLVTQVQKILFFGSILSLICLLIAMAIFFCFKSLSCDRVTIHIHLMAALALRYVLLFIISEPFVVGRTTHYRSENWTCKAVLLAYFYATVTSVNWMFIQGVYLNSKLTTNVFDKEAPFKLYYTFGWLIPIPLIAIYAMAMQANHSAYCWKGYGDLDEIWIILGPVLFALVVNLGLLLNILRILATKVHTPNPSSDTAKIFRRAAKATLILSPVLGINNLLFVYNPGGIYNKYYILLNTLCCSLQGVFVALVYCYMSSEVHSALRRCYRRFKARRDASRRILRRRNSQSSISGIVVERPVRGRNRPQMRSYSSSETLQSTSTLRGSRATQINRLYPLSGMSERTLYRNGSSTRTRQHVVYLTRRDNSEHFGSARCVVQDKTVEPGIVIPLNELAHLPY